MKELAILLEKLSALEQQQKWHEIIELDTEVRAVVTDYMTHHAMTGDKEGVHYLQSIQELYNRGIASHEGNKAESAKGMKSIQAGLSAAKSYLDHTRVRSKN